MYLSEKKDYKKAVDAVNKMTINNLFARAVTEQKVDGKIFINNPDDPTVFYIIHPYGMTLLLGESNDCNFNEAFKNHALNLDKTRKQHEWMQAFPSDWDSVLPILLGDKLIKSEQNFNQLSDGIVELNTRLNFKFNVDRYKAIHKNIADPEIKILKADRKLLREMKGSVVPSFFWKSEDDFVENGLAFALLYKDQLASMAFSSCWFDNLFELGIETEPGFRGRGFAELVCSSLIEYCLENSLEPIWACRKENVGSQKLALKLGFEISKSLPYYRLSN